ncbi:glycosyltransferase [Cryobacterium sp. TMB1-7]|uniref:glycosyltransferase n=1 Tax=Cryobacterium sp. TMB1-7 TaxID=2555866 RepID=UPI00106C6DBE|nr:glycosyltransferase [Cryobacterium sp. TMB1-7]TFC61640.1 glycosyltransferase [Cryobacterium sp. TMB1-7]
MTDNGNNRALRGDDRQGESSTVRKIKVVHLLGALNPSGMERMLVSGAEHFARHGVEALVVGQGETHPYSNELCAAGYDVVTIPSVRTLKGALALRLLIRRTSPDVLHIHSEGGYAISSLSAVFCSSGPAVIRTVHNVFTPRGRTRLSRRIQSAIGDAVARFLVVPSPDVQANEAQFGRKTTLIYNWVADDIGVTQQNPPQPVLDETQSALIVGNCSAIKNHELVLGLLFNGGFDLYHHGDESHASADEHEWLERFSAAGRLRSRGSAAPTESLKQASFFVMPSTQEGMPVSLAEALTAGLPALVSDVAGLRWAGTVRRVRLVSNDLDSWSAALDKTSIENLQIEAGDVPPDFSAARGVAEYVHLYRQAADVESSVL